MINNYTDKIKNGLKIIILRSERINFSFQITTPIMNKFFTIMKTSLRRIPLAITLIHYELMTRI